MNSETFASLVLKYVMGFGAATLLSLIGYVAVMQRWIESDVLTMAFILLLAVIQLVVQLVCFLHLGGGRSRDRTTAIGFTILMMLIIVVGSLWIMKNLDYRMGMSSEAMNEYMEAQNKKGF